MTRSSGGKRYRRARGTKQPLTRVLIVCEGESERNYFEEIRKKYHVPVPNLKVIVSDGPQIRKIVDFAVSVFKKDGDYDHVYAVFDKDDEINLQNQFDHAEAEISKLKRKFKKPDSFNLTLSVPCFEIWPLLHFEYFEEQISRDELFKKLRKYIPTYSKAMPNLFELISHKQDVAHKNAELLRVKIDKKRKSPFTRLHLLVEHLERLFLKS